MAFTYKVSGGLAFVTGVEKAFSITAQSDTAVSTLGRFKVTISGAGLVPSDIAASYDTGGGVYASLVMTQSGADLVTYFGPSTGIQYDTTPHTSNFKATWAAGNRGGYTFKVEFVAVSDGSNIGGSGSFALAVGAPLASVSVEVDPISRIEGHLGAKVTTDANGFISEANVHGNLWRGFENFLIGRRVNDAITFTQRICGVCPVPHGTAATLAADSVLGVSKGYATFAQVNGTGDGVPEAAVLVRNMVLGSEFLMSSLVHFYHLVALSYVQGPPIPPWTPYFPDEQYHPFLLSNGRALPVSAGGYSVDLWSAVIKQYVKALRIRRMTFEAGALFAGRMPMMSNSVAGGTTNNFQSRSDFDNKCNAFRDIMKEIGKFVVSEYVPLLLALGYLYPEFDNTHNAGGQGYGAGLGNFLAWGAFPGVDTNGTLAIKGGWVVGADQTGATVHDLLVDRTNLDVSIQSIKDNLLEYITHSRYANTHGYSAGVNYAYPGDVEMTEPVRDQDANGKYSWMKAPRFAGHAMEVGPLARMVINGKYPVDGSAIVTGAYATTYTAAGLLDANMISMDLIKGFAGSATGGDVTAAVSALTTFVTGLKGGLSTMDRLRARAIESFWMIAYLIGLPTKGTSGPDSMTFAGNGWVDQLQALGGTSVPKFFREFQPLAGTVSGFGLTEAPRGALGHFVTATNGKINHYQCVVPTTWNGSPKDDVATNRGAIEQALIGVPFINPGVPAHIGGRDVMSGVEVLRVAQSFDPCIACAIH